ncbi:hypothetical protein AKJ57_03460 [candidate division MSBL1 archaeon SCGC-AAA259A05]|uniref:Uncharacterized protein n=1 Tax=candidate division MSBL1 archaeon SCGC-AAA259A05 TaxID=1698259 RepID=A0A133U9H2_9EURY|nr:hypothetical protein AKJ57_03460 [candidate division MSBL1 archaeon SCGC-AAA259A05]
MPLKASFIPPQSTSSLVFLTSDSGFSKYSTGAVFLPDYFLASRFFRQGEKGDMYKEELEEK